MKRSICAYEAPLVVGSALDSRYKFNGCVPQFNSYEVSDEAGTGDFEIELRIMDTKTRDIVMGPTKLYFIDEGGPWKIDDFQFLPN